MSDTEQVKPTYSGRIDLGHIIQAAVLIVTVLSGVIGIYIATVSRVATQGEIIIGLQNQVIDMGKRMGQMQDEQKQMARDFNASLKEVSTVLTEFRVLVAKSLDGRK